MARLVLILVCGALGNIVVPVAAADEFAAFGYSPSGSADFSDALGPEALAREMALNAAPDSDLLKSTRRKAGNITTKATVSIFGSISNNLGQPLCALVLANGQFVFSCSPNGQWALTVPQDTNGQVTLFGFADGHFPYKQVFGGSGGRQDMLLTVATNQTVPQAPLLEAISFNITDGCNNGISIDYKFYDETNNLVWPSASSFYFTSALNATYSSNLSCESGANVCYGARSTVNGSQVYWGVDLDNSKSCTNCCITCVNGNSLSRTLTC
jgi:hypothetical protein